jgi:hypothetical protein
LHNISPYATELLHDINLLGSQHVDEEVCGWGQWLAHPHGSYGHGVPRVSTDKPTGKPISVQCDNQSTTGAAKVGGGGGGDGNSYSSGDNGNKGGSGGGKDNSGDSTAAAVAAAGAMKTMACPKRKA